MIRRRRYAMLTVDTEALPRRATTDHVRRLMWGEHERGRAGVAEMVAIGNEFGAKHVFFVDVCGAYASLAESLEVVRWLDAAGHDVQLHTHPEYLPDSFWKERNLPVHPKWTHSYTDPARAAFVFGHCASLLTQVTGKPILGHRAGSFRWNSCTLEALKTLGIPLSFNNSMLAKTQDRCPHSEPTNAPFRWSNGIIEIPTSEKLVPRKLGSSQHRWVRLNYPESPDFRFQSWWHHLKHDPFGRSADLTVILLHSWSLLEWDGQGHATFNDDRPVEGYRKMVARLTRDYEVITTKECLDLIAAGKIRPTHTVDVAKTALPPAAPRPATAKPS